jgi:signal transduction histidine kinase
MITIPRQIRWAVEPVVAILFLLDCIFSEVGRNGTSVVAWLPSIAIAVSIALSRLIPIAALSVAGGLLILQWTITPLEFSDTGSPAYFGLALTLIGVLLSGNRRVRHIAVAVFVLVGALIGCLPYRGGSDLELIFGSHLERIPVALSIAVVYFVGAVCWLIAFGLRAALRIGAAESAKQRAISELQGTELELSMAVQRDRIAQDVHDIMAHSLSVIVAQADGARFVGKKRPASIDQSLEAIAQSARESLAEVRMLIETLVSEPEGHSHPTLEGLAALVERMESAGVSVSYTTFGEAESLTAGQELAVYRIVQEALTNALKHGGAQPTARVVLDWRGSGLALNISSSPIGSSGGEDVGSRGIYGMRERARLAGGWLTASPDEAGQEFLVTAFIPASSLVGAAA